jgi:2-aminoadipate transaminase
VKTISFARGIPAPECLPVEALADCAKAAIERDGSVALSYGSTLGYPPLREWLAERHGVEPDRVLVTNGSLQAFHFVLDALGGGGRVLVERPTYDRPRKILASAGLELAEVAVDGHGLVVDELERGLEGPPVAFLYTIPTFQNPTGSTLSADRRRRLAELVGTRRLPVLEDDPYGLVRFEGEPLPSLFELEGGVDVMYSSSFSKTVAPGLRVGYAIVPAGLTGELEELVASTYITPALLAEATVYEFLRRGLFEPNLERVRGLLRARRDAMLEALDRELTGRARWPPRGRLLPVARAAGGSGRVGIARPGRRGGRDVRAGRGLRRPSVIGSSRLQHRLAGGDRRGRAAAGEATYGGACAGLAARAARRPAARARR